MHSPYNNRTLSIVFAVLLAVFLLTRFTQGGRQESNFRTQLVTLDTAQVSTITLRPPGDADAIVFQESEGNWRVQQGEVTAQADQSAVEGLLGTLLDLKPQRLAARSSEQWNTFEVTDSLGTRVEVSEGDQTVVDLFIGKFSIQATPPPPRQPGMPPMQQPQPKATSYVRLADEPEVYAVEGFLSSAFNRPFNSWRNREFLTVDPAKVNQVDFTYPADSSYTLRQQDSAWMVNDTEADSARVVNYFNQLQNLSSSDFNDTFSASGSPEFVATLQTTDGDVRIEGYTQDSTFVIRTNRRPEVFVNSDRDGLFSRVFVGRNALVKDEGL